MSTSPLAYSGDQLPAELHNGDRMSRQVFHAVYERMPEEYKAELIGGTVFVASPLKRSHATNHVLFSLICATYQTHTAGVEVCDNATVYLNDEDEVQPDILLRILPEFGGQSFNTMDEYIQGAPELIIEIAHSSWAIDLHAKKDRYAVAGVLEYIVFCLQPKQLRWINLQSGKSICADEKGIFRSLIFPGLWIQEGAVMELDHKQALTTLTLGLASQEHKEFVVQLATRKEPDRG